MPKILISGTAPLPFSLPRPTMHGRTSRKAAGRVLLAPLRGDSPSHPRGRLGHAVTPPFARKSKGSALALSKSLPPKKTEDSADPLRQAQRGKRRQCPCFSVPREGSFRLLPRSRRRAEVQRSAAPQTQKETTL